MNVNPTTARKAQDDAKKTSTAPKAKAAPMTGATGASASGAKAPPPVTTAMGFIQEK